MITIEEHNYLLKEMKNILDKYDHNYETYALEKILDTWLVQKANLIKAFKKHPNYLEGKFMIAFDADFDREIDKEVSREFSRWLFQTMKEMKDTLPEEIKELADKTETNMWGDTISMVHDSSKLPYDLHFILTGLVSYAQRTVSQELANMLEKEIPNAHIHAGMKTSRAINKVCTYLGYNKHPEYNKEFAKYADSLSPLKITRHTILSINPIDYLTMSIGNSWSSCHTINKGDGGCYSSGTISYMLDGSSMVFYTINADYDGDEYFKERKVTRQMFYYGEDKLVQSRLYPQSNDYGSKEIYDSYRQIVQGIMSVIFDFPNYWTVSKGTENASKYICSEGTHYQDYYNFSNCTLSRIKGNENENDFIVGHEPICIECGYTHGIEDSINCCRGNGYTCECCGAWVDEDNAYWVNDYPYCGNCVTYCQECGEYEINDNIRWVDSVDGYVCDYCLDNYFITCDDCGEWVRTSDSRYIEEYNRDLCYDCYHDNYTRCEECGAIVANDELEEDEEGRHLCSNCYENLQNEAC